jgi:hypothetical protein
MSIDANRAGAARHISDDHQAQGARRPYVAPSLGLSHSVRDLTKGAMGSGTDAGGTPGFLMMAMT